MFLIKPKKRVAFQIVVSCIFLASVAVCAQDGDIVGFRLLETFTTGLNGKGIRVGQPEAEDSSGLDATNNWEVNPTAVDRRVSLFTWYSNGLSSGAVPNSLGTESGHADSVAGILYGPSGMATNVIHVDNFEANSYINDYIVKDQGFSGTATDSVVNQSYTFGPMDAQDQEKDDSEFDNFSEKYNTLFISAADNYGTAPPNSVRVCVPGTSYNCICVGADDGDSSVGPTIDNGRCKPDIVAPSGETSFSTPQVAGAAALLMQAGRRGDGGLNTNGASDMRTVKALLLNGAVKQANWMNVPPSPLDYTNGAGMLNVFNAYEQLAGGKHGWNFSTNVPLGAAHPPAAVATSVSSLNGWDFNTNDSSATQDAINHYFFNVTNGVGSDFTLTATLVWNRHQNETAINNLALFLYNAVTGNLVAASTSIVDNVQQVFVRQLPQGRYDLQVWKAGGSGIVTTNETYALAWEIVSELLNVNGSGTNLVLRWPVYPDGYTVASALSLTPPIIWSTNGVPAPIITNGQNKVVIPRTSNDQFFRLQTPDF